MAGIRNNTREMALIAVNSRYTEPVYEITAIELEASVEQSCEPVYELAIGSYEWNVIYNYTFTIGSYRMRNSSTWTEK